MKLAYQVGDRPTPAKTLAFALQQLLAIMAATIAVPNIIGNGMSPTAALFGAGIRIVSSLPVLGQLVSTACILFAFGWLWMLAFGKKEPELFVNEGTVVNDFTV